MATTKTTSIVKPTVRAISQQELNTAAKRMILNDGQLIPSGGVKPKIWTCGWYNQILTESNKEDFCYKKGDAVWINTEDVGQFVQHNRSYIKSVVMNNSYLLAEFQKIAGDTSAEDELFRKVATGEVTGNAAGLPLYYLGSLLQPTKIRVSLSSGNDKLPTDDGWWKDFFKNQDTTQFSDDLNAFFDQTLSAAINKHLVEYHLSGITQQWQEEYGQSKSLEDFYLLKDLSNVDHAQAYNDNPGEDNYGFDYVVHFYKKSSFSGDSKTCKWYRIWKSGYLEHGGIVKNEAAQATKMGDSLAYDGRFYKVNLAWGTGAGVGDTAPSYRYSLNTDNFYSEATSLDLGDGHALQLEDRYSMLGATSRYNVQVTPMMTDASKAPYQTMHPQSKNNGPYYLAKDVVSMTNSSFCFLLDPDVQYYSYYTSGFAPNVQQGL